LTEKNYISNSTASTYNSCLTVSIEGYAQTETTTHLAQLGIVQCVATGTHTIISKTDNKTPSLNPLAEDW